MAANLNYTVSEIDNRLNKIKREKDDKYIDERVDDIRKELNTEKTDRSNQDTALSNRITAIENELKPSADSSGEYHSRLDNIEEELDFYKDDNGEYHSRLDNIEEELDFYKDDNGEYHSRLDDIDGVIGDIIDQIGSESYIEDDTILGKIADLDSRKLNIIENDTAWTCVYAQIANNGGTQPLKVSISYAEPSSIVQRNSNGSICAKDYILTNYNGILENNVSLSNYVEALNNEIYGANPTTSESRIDRLETKVADTTNFVNKIRLKADFNNWQSMVKQLLIALRDDNQSPNVKEIRESIIMLRDVSSNDTIQLDFNGEIKLERNNGYYYLFSGKWMDHDYKVKNVQFIIWGASFLKDLSTFNIFEIRVENLGITQSETHYTKYN